MNTKAIFHKWGGLGVESMKNAPLVQGMFLKAQGKGRILCSFSHSNWKSWWQHTACSWPGRPCCLYYHTPMAQRKQGVSVFGIQLPWIPQPPSIGEGQWLFHSGQWSLQANNLTICKWFSLMLVSSQYWPSFLSFPSWSPNTQVEPHLWNNLPLLCLEAVE